MPPAEIDINDATFAVYLDAKGNPVVLISNPRTEPIHLLALTVVVQRAIVGEVAVAVGVNADFVLLRIPQRTDTHIYFSCIGRRWETSKSELVSKHSESIRSIRGHFPDASRKADLAVNRYHRRFKLD